VQDASRDFEARPEGTDRPTRGSYRSDGDSDPTDISSGRQRGANQDLDHTRLQTTDGRPLRGQPLSFDHAEATPAQRMRADGRSTEVVLDNTTCGTRAFDSSGPLTCARLLPGMMPAGSTMTVWGSVDGGQTFFRGVITGTGSLIR
jgi:hypothetical protein